MTNKKILAWLLLSSLIIAWVWSTFAANNNSGSTNTGTVSNWFLKNKWFNPEKHFRWNLFDLEKGFKWGWFKNNLTDTEKKSLDSMTDEQKKAFFSKKMEEQIKVMEKNKADRDLKEWVIDTLLAWWTLTTEQQALRTEIIKERADRKKDMIEHESQMKEIKTIIDKKNTWAELTSDEKLKIENMKDFKREWNHKWEREWMHKWEREFR